MSLRFLAIIGHPSEPRLLVVRRDGAWALPEWPLEGEPDSASAYGAPPWEINPIVGTGLHLNVTCLLCLRPWTRDAGPDEPAIYAFESHGMDRSPERRWVNREEASGLKATETVAQVLSEWYDEAEGAGPPALRPDWARPGWLTDAAPWIDDKLSGCGLTRAGSLEQVKSWSISCVLRVPLERGVAFFKAVPPVFAREPRVTCELARLLPALMPDVLAVDETRRWMLMREFPGVRLNQVERLDVWQDALRRFARLQLDCASCTADLFAWGCADRRLSTLAEEFNHLVTSAADPSWREVYGLTAADLEALSAAAPEVRRMSEDLAAFGLPDTLIHGDLHAGNVQWADPDPTYFDWSDAAVTHPFFDMPTLIQPDTRRPISSDSESLALLRDAYLGPWAERMPMSHLRAAFALSQRLAPAYHALSYRDIAHQTEPASRWELCGGVGMYCRKLLAAIDDQAPSTLG